MNTLDYIRGRLPTRDFFQKEKTIIGSIGRFSIDSGHIEWLHDHSRLINISRLAIDCLALSPLLLAPDWRSFGVALGVARMATFAAKNKAESDLKLTRTDSLVVWFLAVAPFAMISDWGLREVTLGAAGMTALLAAEFIHSTLLHRNILSSPFTQKIFTPGKYGVGELRYQGRVPILTLNAENPRKAGEAHGYLCAPQIVHLFSRLIGPQDPRKLSELRTSFSKLDIPEAMKEEIRGIAMGVRQWNMNQWWFKRHKLMFWEEVMLCNLIADSLYYDAKKVSQSVSEANKTEKKSPVACTTLMGKNKVSGVVLGRLLDWEASGVLGTSTLIINRKYSGQRRNTVEVSIPGSVGTLTGMNDTGFSLAMNVSNPGRLQPGGIPSTFYNRMILENASSVQGAKEWICHQTSSLEQVGGYYLRKGALPHHFRDLGKKPLVTCNDEFSTVPKKGTGMCGRTKRLEQLFADTEKAIGLKKANLEELFLAALQLPKVNKLDTVQSVQMIPQKRIMRVAADNSFAASLPFEEIDAAPLLK